MNKKIILFVVLCTLFLMASGITVTCFATDTLAQTQVQKSDIARGDFLKVDYGDGNWQVYWVEFNNGQGADILLRNNALGYGRYDWDALKRYNLQVYKWATPEWLEMAKQYLH